MPRADKSAIPTHSFMQPFTEIEGCSADAFKSSVEFPVALEEFIQAFFGSTAFQMERTLLKIMGKPYVSPADIKALAAGQQAQFAIWQVKERSDHEIMLKVGDGPIRSWLMVLPEQNGKTSLYFGSAVLPQGKTKNGTPQIGFLFRTLIGFHNFYSRLLLNSAIKKLIQTHTKTAA